MDLASSTKRQLERGIDTWAHTWRLAPRITLDSKGAVRHDGYVQYPASLLLPPCLAAIWMFGWAHGTTPGNIVAVCCALLGVMLGALSYCFAKVRIAALLPELGKDEVIRAARFVMAPAFMIETLRIVLAGVMAYHGKVDTLALFRNVAHPGVVLRNPTEILTVFAFLLVVLRFYFAMRQIDRRRPGRVLIANGVLLVLALAISDGLMGAGIYLGMGATPGVQP